jgi:hypothetical protein
VGHLAQVGKSYICLIGLVRTLVSFRYYFIVLASVVYFASYLSHSSLHHLNFIVSIAISYTCIQYYLSYLMYTYMYTQHVHKLRRQVESFFEGYNNSKAEKVKFIYCSKMKGRNPGYQVTVIFPRQPEEDEKKQGADEEAVKDETDEEDEDEEDEEAGSWFDLLVPKEDLPGPNITTQPIKYFVKLQTFYLNEITVYFFLQHSGLGPEEVSTLHIVPSPILSSKICCLLLFITNST